MWDARDRLRPHREPEVARVDVAGPLLDLLAYALRFGGRQIDLIVQDMPVALL